MYNEIDKHCRECICPECDLFQTGECLEGPDQCATKCDNKSHVAHCWWNPWESEEEHD